MSMFPGSVPLYAPGKEPLPPGLTEDDRPQLEQTKKMEKFMHAAMESCVVKAGMSAGVGFGLGAFFSMMSQSFAYEDPLMRGVVSAQPGLSTRQQTVVFFKDLGKNMFRSGRSFGRIGGIYAAVECVIESYRAKNDMVNPVAGGFVTGAILARASGPRAALGGGLAFAAFSGAIDLFLRRETKECATPRSAPAPS